MKFKIRHLILLLFLLGLSFQSYAASPWTEEVGYKDKVIGKFLFGMANFYGGWVSLFIEPETYAKDGKNVFAGVGRGLMKTVVLTTGGAAHLVTAPITALDIPLPDNGVDM